MKRSTLVLGITSVRNYWTHKGRDFSSKITTSLIVSKTSIHFQARNNPLLVKNIPVALCGYHNIRSWWKCVKVTSVPLLRKATWKQRAISGNISHQTSFYNKSCSFTPTYQLAKIRCGKQQNMARSCTKWNCALKMKPTRKISVDIRLSPKKNPISFRNTLCTIWGFHHETSVKLTVKLVMKHMHFCLFHFPFRNALRWKIIYFYLSRRVFTKFYLPTKRKK